MDDRINGYTMDQLIALMMLESGDNVFLTGGAGTGKTYVIQQFIRRHPDKTILITASTGLAAVSIDGTTLHSTFRIPLKPIGPDDIEEIKNEPMGNLPTGAQNILEILEKVDVVIIDEISMCRFDCFSYFAAILARAHQCYPQRKIQVIIVGDFYQLPPVLKENKENHERSVLRKLWGLDTEKPLDGFAFESASWDQFHFHPAILKEVVRQRDQTFIGNLNLLRIGQLSTHSLYDDDNPLKEIQDMCRQEENASAIYLYSLREKAKERNERILRTLPGPERTFKLTIEGSAKIPTEEIIPPLELHLKIGARVMAVRNERVRPGQPRQYLNGLQGTVESIDEDPEDENKTTITVHFDNGKHVPLRKQDWEVTRWSIVEKKASAISPEEKEWYTWKPSKKPGYKWSLQKKVIAVYFQYPLRLAYAMTIHKAQGQTFEDVNISLDGVFAPGQVYVGLSRCTTPRGLYIAPFSLYKVSHRIAPSPSVSQFYAKIEMDPTLPAYREKMLQTAKALPDFSADLAKVEAKEQEIQKSRDIIRKIEQEAKEKMNPRPAPVKEEEKAPVSAFEQYQKKQHEQWEAEQKTLAKQKEDDIANAKAKQEALHQERIKLAKQVKNYNSLQGKHVRHPEWGEGRIFFVFALEGKFSVRFPSVGKRDFKFSDIGTTLTLLEH